MTSSNPASGDLGQELEKIDIDLITDEDHLRKLWQSTEDFAEKRRIRTRMYKLREQRLKEFYTSNDVVESPNKKTMSSSTKMEVEYSCSSADGDTDAQKRRGLDEHDIISEKIRRKDEERSERYHNLMNEMETATTASASGQAMFSTMSHLESSSHTFVTLDSTRAEDLGYDSMQMESGAMSIVTGSSVTDGTIPSATQLEEDGDASTAQRTNAEKPVVKTNKSRRISTEKDSPTRKLSFETKKESPTRKKSDARKSSSGGIPSEEVKTGSTASPNRRKSKDSTTPPSRKKSTELKSVTEKVDTNKVVLSTSSRPVQITYREEQRQTSRRETTDGKTTTVVETTEFIRYPEPGTAQTSQPRTKERVTISKTTIIDSNGTVLDENEDETVEELPYDSPVVNLSLQALLSRPSATDEYREESRRVSQRETSDGKTRTEVEVVETTRRHLKRNELEKVTQTKTTVYDTNGGILDTHEDEAIEVLEETTTSPSGPIRSDVPPVSILDQLASPDIATRMNLLSKPLVCVLSTTSDYVEERRRVSRQETGDSQGQTCIEITEESIRYYKNPSIQPRRVKVIVKRITVLNQEGSIVDEKEEETSEPLSDPPVEDSQPEVVTLKSKPARKTSKKVTRGRKTSDIRPLLTTTDGDFIEEEREVTRRETSDGKLTKVVLVTIIIRRAKNSPKRERLTVTKTTILDSQGEIVEEDENSHTEEVRDEPVEEPVVAVKQPFKVGPKGDQDDGCRKHRQGSDSEAKIAPVAHVPLNATAAAPNVDDDIIPNVEETVTPKKAFRVCDPLEPTPSIDDGLLEPPGHGKPDAIEEPTTAPRSSRPSDVEISEMNLDDDVIPDGSVERRYSVITPEPMRSPDIPSGPPRMEIEEVKPVNHQEEEDERDIDEDPRKKTVGSPVKQPKKKTDVLSEPKKPGSRIPTTKETAVSAPRRGNTSELKPRTGTKDAESSKPASKSQIPAPKTKSPTKDGDSANSPLSRTRGTPSDPNDARNLSPQRKSKETAEEPKKRILNSTTNKPVRPDNLEINGVSQASPQQRTPLSSPDRSSPLKPRKPFSDKEGRSDSPQRRCCGRHSGEVPKVNSPVTATSPTRSKIPRSESPLKKPQQDLTESPALKHLETDKDRPESPSRSKLRYSSPVPKVSEPSTPTKTTRSVPQGTTASPKKPATPTASSSGIPTRTDSPKPAKGVPSSVVANLPEELRNRPMMTKTVEYTKVYRVRDDDKPWRVNSKPAEPKKDLHQSVMQVVEKYVDCENCEIHGHKKHKEPERIKKDDAPKSPSTPKVASPEKLRRVDKSEPPATRDASPSKQPELEDDIDEPTEAYHQPDDDAEFIQPNRAASPESIDEDYITKRRNEPFSSPSGGPSTTNTEPEKAAELERDAPLEPKDKFRPVQPSDDEEDLAPRRRSRSPPKSLQPESFTTLPTPSSPTKDIDARQALTASPALDSPSAVIKAIKSTLDSPTSSRKSPEKDSCLPARLKGKSPEKEDAPSVGKPSQISQIRHGYENKKDDAPVRPVRKSSLKKTTDEPNKINRIRNAFEKPESPSSTSKEPKENTVRRTPSQVNKKPFTEEAPSTPTGILPTTKAPTEPGNQIIEEIEDVPLLEQMLDTATNYDDRSRIRAQIRIVKKKQGAPSKTPGSSSPMLGRRTMPVTSDTPNQRKSLSKPNDLDRPVDDSPIPETQPATLTQEPDSEDQVPSRRTSASREPMSPARKPSNERKTSSPSRSPNKESRPFIQSDPKPPSAEPEHSIEKPVQERPETTEQEEIPQQREEVPWRRSPDRERPRQSPMKEIPLRETTPSEQVAPWRRSPEKEIQPTRRSPAREAPPKPAEETTAPWRKTSASQLPGTPDQERPSASRPALTTQLSQSKLRTPTHLPEDDFSQPPADLQDITSSYGTGPTDENGLPLFGLGALRRKPKTSDTKSPADISSALSQDGLKEPKEPKDHGPTDSSGRPLFGLRAIVVKPDNEGVPKGPEEDTSTPVVPRSPNLHAIIRKHEDAADKPEPPKSPALKPKSKLRDSFIRPVEDEVDDRPRSPLPDKTISDRSQPLKQIIQKHQQAVETATITRTSIIDEEKSIHDRSQPLRDIIQRHETLSNHGEPTPQPSSPAPVAKRPGILKKPKEASSPQETPSPTKENVEFLPSEPSPSKPAISREPSPVKETETRPRAPTEEPNHRDSYIDQPQPVAETREPEEVRRTSVSYFSSTTTTSVRRSVTPERNVYTSSTVLPSPTAPVQPRVPSQDIPAPATTESPRTRGIPIEGRPYRGSVKETPKWPPTKETKEPVQVPRRPSATSSGAEPPTRPWSTPTNAPQPRPAEEPQPERRPSQVSYIEIPLSRPTPEPVTKRPSQAELVPEPARVPQDPLQQFKPLTSASILRGRFDSPNPQDATPQPEKTTNTPTSSAPWRSRQPTPESDRRPMPSATAPSATAPSTSAPWRRHRDEPVPHSSQPRTSTTSAPQPKQDSEPFTSTITLPLRRPSETARESPERRPSQSVTQTSYLSSSTVVASTTFRSPRASVSPDRHVPSDSNPPRRISNAFPETVPAEPQERYTSSTILPQRKPSDASLSSPLRKPSQVSDVHSISLTGETTGHTVKSVSTFQLQLGNTSVSPAVPIPGLGTQPDSSSATPTAPWRKQSQEQRTPQCPQEAKPAPSPSVVNRPEESPSQFTPTMAAPNTTTSTPTSSRKTSIDATPSPSSATRPNIRTGAGGSIRALAQKFLENGDSSTPKAAYPRAGLIFRSSSFRQGQQPDSDGQGLQRSASLRVRTPDRRSQDRESPEKTPSYQQSTSLEVNIGTPTNASLPRRTTLEPADEKVEQSFNETRKTSVTSVTLTPVQPSTNSGSPYTRSPHARSFLEDHTPVTGINDIMDRMRAAEPAQPGDQDAEARSLLNKFLGAQVIVQSMDPWAKQNLGATPLTESIISTSVNVSDDGKSVSRTVAAAQKGGSSTSSSGVDSTGRQWTSSSATSAASFKSHTITQAMGEPCIVGGIDIDSCDDDFKLNELLDNCDDYETRRKIRARIKQVLAEQQGEGFSPSVAEGGNVTRRTSNTVSSQNEVITQRSSFSSSSFRSTSKGPGNSAFAKFQQLDQSAAKTPRLGQLARFSSVTSSTSGTHVVRSASDVKDLLLKWCQARTRGYQNVAIENFSSSWSNGLAFCALIHHFYPDAFDYTQLKPENRRQNFELAFKVAEEKAGIAPLLDVEDMVFMARPDWKCVFTYVQSIYRRLKNE